MDETRKKEVFPENLKYYLQLKDVTQKEVAAFCGVSQGTFCDWVKGTSYPRMGKIQKLADYFQIEKSDLIEERSLNSSYYLNKEAQLILEEIKKDTKALELYQGIKKLSPANREIVLSLIKSLNKEE